ncbi:MAG: hypothetical protein AAF989_03910 [Planctomycetota bacterium]
MSTLPSNEPIRKQPASVYTVMLVLSTIFMLIAVIAMWLEMSRWGPDYSNTDAARPSVMVVDASAKLYS